MHFVGNLNGIAIGLPVDVDEQRRLSIRRDDRVDRLDGGRDGSDIADVHRDSRLSRLDHYTANLFRSAHLPVDEAENKLMIFFQQTGGIDQVGASHRLQDVGNRDTGHQQLGRIGNNVKLRLLPALDQHC